MAKTTSATSTAQVKKSSTKPTQSQVPMSGMWKYLSKRRPYASMIVSSRMVKPHMVKKWARPGTVHWRSLRCPATSTVSASTLRLRGPRDRFGSFFPERMSLDSQWNRRAAMPKPTTVTKRPMTILTGTNAPRLELLTSYLEWAGGGVASATWDFSAPRG